MDTHVAWPSTDEMLAELTPLLRIPSVSAATAHAADVAAALDWVVDYVRRAGGTAQVDERHGAPLAVGHIPASEGNGRGKPRVLLYGHVDVQPAGDLAAWRFPPFDATPSDGWLYGRGTADDKGQLYILLKAVQQLAARGALPVDVDVLVDGEEEVGGLSAAAWIDGLEEVPDACVVLDVTMLARDRPVLCTGTRGNLYCHLEVRTGEHDLHSGDFGGAALNANHVLIRLLDRAVQEMPARLGDASCATDDDRAAWTSLPDGERLLAEVGARPMDEAALVDFHDRTQCRMSIDVNGIAGGEARLRKTILPVQAQANISMRLPPTIDPDAARAALRACIDEHAPAGASVDLRIVSAVRGSDLGGGELLGMADQAFRGSAGWQAARMRIGATLPVAGALGLRGIPTVLTGFGTPDSCIHAPDERLPIEHLGIGVRFVVGLVQAIAASR